MASALVIAGSTRLAGRYRLGHEVDEALTLLYEATDLFPVQKDIENYNTILATAIAWTILAKETVWRSSKRNALSKANRERKIDYKYSNAELSDEMDCKIQWTARRPPKFPKEENKRGLYGVVLYVYRVGDDGNVVDARKLAEIPRDSGFCRESMEVVNSWKANVESLPPSACRKNRMAHMLYTWS